MTWHIEHGDCLDVLRSIPDASIDSIVTDPPAGISFMGKGWDDDKGGPAEWISWLASIMSECLRVLKPGGHALVWAIPRTSHWTGMAIEFAGFEIRDVVTHLFGSGFPKSLNVSKAIDAADGLKDARAIVSTYTAGGNAGVSTADKGGTYGVGVGTAAPVELAITRGASERSRAWDGWGTALKPACEFWFLTRKPLAGTVVRNVLEHGTGAINVDGCRIEVSAEDREHVKGREWVATNLERGTFGAFDGDGKRRPIDYAPAGRWPANVVLSHSEDCYLTGSLYHDEPGPCPPHCPVAMLDAQSGNRRNGGQNRTSDRRSVSVAHGEYEPGAPTRYAGDSGGASRFFYTAKTSTKEREAGLDALPKRGAAELTGSQEGAARLDSPRTGAGRTSGGRANHHPTVKPIALMRWLVRLVTPPGGVVLDPFMGSGSTGCAAVLEGFAFLGIEQDAEYVEIAKARIAHWETKKC